MKSSRRLHIGLGLGLLVLIFATFMPALQAGFVMWDDDDLLLGSPPFRELNLESVRWMFSTSYAGHFQPLTWLSYSLDYQIWRGDAFGYHLTNVVLHALTALTFLAVAKTLLAPAVGAPQSGPAHATCWGAGFAAAVFAVHPLRAESVAWLAERRDVLGGWFFLLSVWCYLRFAALGRDHRAFRTRLWYGAALAMCALSLLAKASAMSLPVVLFILDVYPLRRTEDLRRAILEKIPFLILAVAAGWRALIAQDAGGALYTLETHGWLTRLAQAVHGLWFYPSRTLVPVGLGPLYEIPPRAVLLGPSLWLKAAVLAGLILLTWRLRRRIPAMAAALAAYFVVVAPVLGVAQSGPQFVADRYSYLSCMSLAVLAGAMLAKWLRASRGPRTRSFIALVASLIVAVLAHRTFAQADYWQSPLSLWSRGVEVSPNSAIAQVSYGDALASAGLYDAAMEHYRRGLSLNPRDAIALHHYAVLLERVGRPDDAIAHYLRSLSIDPNRRAACFALGRLLFERDRPREAAAVLRDGFRRHGVDDARLLLVLADALAELEEFGEARAAALQAQTLAEKAGDESLIQAALSRGELFDRKQTFPRARR